MFSIVNSTMKMNKNAPVTPVLDLVAVVVM